MDRSFQEAAKRTCYPVGWQSSKSRGGFFPKIKLSVEMELWAILFYLFYFRI